MKRLFDLSCSLFVDAFVFARNLFFNHPVPFVILGITLLVVSFVSDGGVVDVLSRYVFVMVSFYLVFFFSWIVLDTAVWRLLVRIFLDDPKVIHDLVKDALQEVDDNASKRTNYKKDVENVFYKLRRLDGDRAVIGFLFLIAFSIAAIASLSSFLLYFVVVFCVFVYIAYRMRQDAGWVNIAYTDVSRTIYLWRKHKRKECHEYIVHSKDKKIRDFWMIYIEVVELSQ